MCLLGNITVTEANVRQNTGEETQSKKELPDIQTGSFHIHYCIFKRQVLTAHFCSARRGGGGGAGIFFLFFGFFSFFFSFWFVLNQCMNVSFLISADGQTGGHYGYVECSRERGEL